MTTLLEKTLSKVSKLPKKNQDMIATIILDELEDEQRWDILFRDPRSEKALDRLVAKAEKDIAEGAVHDFDPSSKPE